MTDGDAAISVIPTPDPDAADAAVDLALVSRAQQGELSAFDELTRRHTARVYQAAFAVLRDHQDAQDIAQDAFFAAWQGLASFRGDSAFGTWLHSIVTRRALNKAGRGHRTVGLDQVSRSTAPGNEPAQAAERAFATRSLAAAVRALPAAQRSAITLHHLEGLSLAQIATRARITVPAVRSHLYRGRRALAAAVSSWS